MSNGQAISIILSPAQVDQVVRAAAQGSTPSFSALITTTLNTQRLAAARGADIAPDGDVAEYEFEPGADDGNGKGYFPTYENARLSRSLLRGLSILTCFGPGKEERGIIELASELGMSPSTTHRYVATLVELGLLERSTRSRKYRLAAAPAAEAEATSEGHGARLS
jgi:IclR helix-turn-helix domain